MDVDELVARADIADVLARYARGVDRCEWDVVRSCYHPDASDDHGLYQGGVDGLLEFLEQLAGQLTSTTHHLGNQLIEIDGVMARSETSCLAWYVRRDRSGAERLVTQGLRYLDSFERRHGRWAITRREVVLDWEHLLQPGQPTTIAETWLRGGRGTADPSHAHLKLGRPAAPAPAERP